MVRGIRPLNECIDVNMNRQRASCAHTKNQRKKEMKRKHTRPYISMKYMEKFQILKCESELYRNKCVCCMNIYRQTMREAKQNQ